MPDAKPMSPERIAEIERLHGEAMHEHWPAVAWRMLAVATIPELLAEVRRLRSAVDRLANAERDLAETNLVLEQQDRDLERMRESNLELQSETEMLADRVAELEAGLREALGRWEYPSPTAADKARKDELWSLVLESKEPHDPE